MNEKLSALMDGELAREEAQVVIKTLGADETQRESWDAYHLIGASLRGELRGDTTGNRVSDGSARNACTDAIFARLAAEPTVLAPSAIRKPSFVENRTRLALAMAAGLTDRLWSFEEMIAAMDEIAPKPGRPKTYKKSGDEISN